MREGRGGVREGGRREGASEEDNIIGGYSFYPIVGVPNTKLSNRIGF